MQKMMLKFMLMAIFIPGTSCVDRDMGPLRQVGEDERQRLYTWSATADSMQSATYVTYLTSEGTFRQDNQGDETFHYWWNAHALDVLVDGYTRTNDEAYLPRMKALLTGIEQRNGGNYVNVFNDDMQWLGIASARAYLVTGDEAYRTVARFLWEENKKSWSDVHGGGLTWRSDRPLGKNACSNGPAAVLAALLYQIDGDEEDLQWARNIFDWLNTTLVDPQSGLVWDNIDIEDGEPVINKDWIFTYNQGSYIGAGLLLYQLTEEQRFLDNVLLTANSSITRSEVTTEGVLKNEDQGDGGLFKGIFIRYFTWLIQEGGVPETDRNRFIEFFRFNAETFYDNGLTRPDMLSSPNWMQSPGEVIDLSTQLSGMMLMEHAAVLEEEDFFNIN